ncbi:MAG: DUF72 domain-containing protein [Candidatus Caldarchaeum sp.]|nr:DUF72 domain-containing protein [Candidatus Caldarchaeum sp.]
MFIYVGRVYVGCCGWSVKGGKAAYFSKFPAVEVQETFYRLPRVETVKRWREQAPDEFVFCMKAWQAVSHPTTSPTWRRAGVDPRQLKNKYGFLRPVEENFEAWDKSAEVAKALRARVVVVQTPASMPADDTAFKDAKQFFEYAAGSGFLVGWEPRGRVAARMDKVYEVCSSTGVIHITDLLRSKPATASRLVYTRLHGLGGREVNYSYRYSDEDLQRLFEAVGELDADEAFVMFNNISMADDAERFAQLLKS